MRFLPSWAFKLIGLHLSGKNSRPAIRFMNLFAFLGVFIGVLAWVSVLSIMNGLQADIRERHLKERPHLQWEGRPIAEPENFEARLKSILGSDLKKVSRILQSEGLIEVPSALRGRITGAGVLIQGREDLKHSVELGAELKDLLRMQSGDEFRLRSVWKLEASPLDLVYTHDFKSEIYDIDKSVVRVSKDVLEKWLGLRQHISMVEIQLHDPLRAPLFREALQKEFQLSFESWQQTQAALWYSLKLEKTMMLLSIFFIIILASLAVHLTMSARVTEKNREIAVLMAMGADPESLRRLYLFEGLILGVVGATAGLGASWVFCQALSRFATLPDFYYSTSIPIVWDWTQSILLGTAAILLSLLASWWPAKRVSQITIAEALRS